MRIDECRCRVCCQLRVQGHTPLHSEPTPDPYEPVTVRSIERARVAAQIERDDVNALIFPRFGAFVDRDGRYHANRFARECGQATPVLMLGALVLIIVALLAFGAWFDAQVESLGQGRNWPVSRGASE